MYIMFPSYKHDSETDSLNYINYDSENKTKEGLQNRLIELYKSVLLNDKVIPDVMTPIDFDFMKDDVRSIYKEKPISNLSLVDPLEDIDVRYGFLAGQAGVGQQANALMDYVLGSMSKQSISNLVVTKSNNILDKQYSNSLSKEDLEYYQKSLNLTDQQISEIKSIKIGNSLSAVLNAFVDIAKDPYITEAGWTTMTTNTGNLLLRYGVHPFYVNALLSQPIVKKYVEFSQTYEQSDSQNLSTLNAFIEQEFGADNYKNFNKSDILNLSLEELRNNIKKEGSSYHRMNTLYTFLKYQTASKALKRSVDASKFMVNGASKNITGLQISKNLVNSTLENEQNFYNSGDTKSNILLGFDSKFRNPNGSESMFSRYYKNVVLGVDKIVKANPKLFLSANHVIQNSFNEISYSVYNTKLHDEKLGDLLEAHTYSYLMSGFKPLNISIEDKRYLLTSFVKEFEEFQKDNEGIYKIVDELIIKAGDGKLNYISLNNRIKSPEVEESLVNSFSDLLNEEPEFAEKLIKYSYLTSGFAMNMNQFFTYVPSQWMIRNQINRYIIDTNNNYLNNFGEFNDSELIDQFFLANLDNSTYVKNINQGQVNTIVTAENELGVSQQFDIRKNGFIMKEPGKQNYYVKKQTDAGSIYYKLVGYTLDFKGIYTRFIKNVDNKYVDVQLLNKKDTKGNRIVNYNVDGLILKPTTEAIGNLATERGQRILNDSVSYGRDHFYRGNVIPNSSPEVINNFEVDIETKIQPQQTSLFDNITTTKVYQELESQFKSNPELFKGFNINSIEELQTKTEDELGEIIKKLCL